MQGRGRGNVAAERICGVLFVGLTPLKGYFYINLGGTLNRRYKEQASKLDLLLIPEFVPLLCSRGFLPTSAVVVIFRDERWKAQRRHSP